MKYKQLPLTGDIDDFINSEDLLTGVTDLYRALGKFYEDNEEFNPRQLHYIVSSYSMDTHLDRLIIWGPPNKQPKPGDDYQGGIYVGEFEGKRYVVSKDEVKLNHKDAIEWCRNYSKDGYNDWFLPNKEELNFLYESKVIENPSSWYWSSTEYGSTDAWIQGFTGSDAGGHYNGIKDVDVGSVRGFRIVNLSLKPEEMI